MVAPSLTAVAAVAVRRTDSGRVPSPSGSPACVPPTCPPRWRPSRPSSAGPSATPRSTPASTGVNVFVAGADGTEVAWYFAGRPARRRRRPSQAAAARPSAVRPRRGGPRPGRRHRARRREASSRPPPSRGFSLRQERQTRAWSVGARCQSTQGGLLERDLRARRRLHWAPTCAESIRLARPAARPAVPSGGWPNARAPRWYRRPRWRRPDSNRPASAPTRSACPVPNRSSPKVAGAGQRAPSRPRPAPPLQARGGLRRGRGGPRGRPGRPGPHRRRPSSSALGVYGDVAGPVGHGAAWLAGALVGVGRYAGAAGARRHRRGVLVDRSLGRPAGPPGPRRRASSCSAVLGLLHLARGPESGAGVPAVTRAGGLARPGRRRAAAAVAAPTRAPSWCWSALIVAGLVLVTRASLRTVAGGRGQRRGGRGQAGLRRRPAGHARGHHAGQRAARWPRRRRAEFIDASRPPACRAARRRSAGAAGRRCTTWRRGGPAQQAAPGGHGGPAVAAPADARGVRRRRPGRAAGHRPRPGGRDRASGSCRRPTCSLRTEEQTVDRRSWPSGVGRWRPRSTATASSTRLLGHDGRSHGHPLRARARRGREGGPGHQPQQGHRLRHGRRRRAHPGAHPGPQGHRGRGAQRAPPPGGARRPPRRRPRPSRPPHPLEVAVGQGHRRAAGVPEPGHHAPPAHRRRHRRRQVERPQLHPHVAS